jgi:hypothetical protein
LSKKNKQTKAVFCGAMKHRLAPAPLYFSMQKYSQSRRTQDEVARYYPAGSRACTLPKTLSCMRCCQAWTSLLQRQAAPQINGIRIKKQTNIDHLLHWMVQKDLWRVQVDSDDQGWQQTKRLVVARLSDAALSCLSSPTQKRSALTLLSMIEVGETLAFFVS